MINKLLTIAIIITFVGSTSPKKMGKTMIKAFKNQDTETISDLYLSLEECKDLFLNSEPKPSEAQVEQMSELFETYADDKKGYIETYFEYVKIHDLNNMEIESIEYDYQVAAPGKDEKIMWPESKDYKPVFSNDKKIKIKYNVKMKDDANNSYTMRFDMMNYKNEWRLFMMIAQPPSIYQEQ